MSIGFLIQALLPLYDNDGKPFDQREYGQVRSELTEHFGGVTVYLRAPAQGLWKDEAGEVARDDIVIFEVMASVLDRDWWNAYRARLERQFRQESLIVRALAIEHL